MISLLTKVRSSKPTQKIEGIHWSSMTNRFLKFKKSYFVAIETRLNHHTDRLWINTASLKTAVTAGITIDQIDELIADLMLYRDVLEHFGEWPTKQEGEAWIESYVEQHNSQI